MSAIENQEKSKGSLIELKPKGMVNLGNLCYMNATLQALLSSSVLNTSLLLYIQTMPEKMVSSTINKFSPVLVEYFKMLIELIKIDAHVYRPIPFKKIIDRENAWFRGHAQHDSHEFMNYIINEFADEKKEKGISSIIQKLCFGKYKQYLCCDECNVVTEKYFNFLDVILPIPQKINPDLEDCFKNFAKFESLDEKNKLSCETCKKKTIFHKRMEIHEVPEIAIFTFCRFINGTKNNSTIRIYESIELEKKKLKLIATVNHYGQTGGGHYVAHALRNGKWYRFDDSNISEIRIASLLNDPSVYMTIYQVDC
jgi:ubiquitin C-terminal hydrolase